MKWSSDKCMDVRVGFNCVTFMEWGSGRSRCPIFLCESSGSFFSLAKEKKDGTSESLLKKKKALSGTKWIGRDGRSKLISSIAKGPMNQREEQFLNASASYRHLKNHSNWGVNMYLQVACNNEIRSDSWSWAESNYFLLVLGLVVGFHLQLVRVNADPFDLELDLTLYNQQRVLPKGEFQKHQCCML